MKVMNMKKILTITIILFSLSAVHAQRVRSLTYNHAIVQAYERGMVPHLKSTVDSIDYVDSFFEDFSTYHDEVFPKSNHFTDRYAFINSTYADSMISLGVATLDAYDQYGFPYYSIDSGLVNSDTLTSQPFSFKAALPDTLYFSFFFQAGGKGDLPEGIISEIQGVEGQDALMVDFYNPLDSAWRQVFYTIDNTDPHHFHKVELAVADSFLQNGFRFRFRNYTSLKQVITQGEDLGQYENDDMWHVDYIRLLNAPSDPNPEQLGDLTITEPLLSTLTEYTSVPWSHYSLAQSAGIERRQVPLTVHDFGGNSGAAITFQRIYETRDLNAASDEVLRKRTQEQLAMPPYNQITFLDDFTTGFYANPDEEMGKLELRAYLETETEQPRENDTVYRTEIYHDHYAYDDGTAEMGFGIDGEYQDLSRIALRFRAFRRNTDPDSLRAVLIYFGKSIDRVTEEAGYKIEVRKNTKNANGLDIPDDEALYESEAIYYPDYSVGLNEFTRIAIDPPLAISDTFFIIIHQLDGYLNIGYDINNDNLHNVYEYTNSRWTRPLNETPGTPMIRASFGTSSYLSEESLTEQAGDFLLFPNPVLDEVNFQFPADNGGNVRVQVYNVLGSLQFSTVTLSRQIPVSSLKPGVYIITVSPEDGSMPYSSKFVKQ